MTAATEDPVEAVAWMIRGQWVTLSIRAAVELGVFDRLEAPTTVGDLAAATSSDPARLARLVRVLADLGLVSVSGAGVGAGVLVSATPRGLTLSRRHRSGLRDLALMQTALPNLAAWQRLAEAVRTGDAVFAAANGLGPWESLSADPAQEAIFNAAMARRGSEQARAILSAGDLTDVEVVIDVGGGRGAMLAEILTATPGLRGVVAERPEVALAAERFFTETGIADRGSAVAADFFQSVPAGGDVYVLANVLHDWPDRDAVRILETIRAAMDPAARLWVVEHLLDAPDRPFGEQRDLHLVDLHMLVMFGACERTTGEYDSLLSVAGFAPGAQLPTAGEWNLIETRPC